MTRATIRSKTDEDLQYRRLEVRANGKAMTTPIKSLSPKPHKSFVSNDDAQYINEAYAGLTERALQNCATGGDQQFVRRIARTMNSFKNTGAAMRLLILEIKGASLPKPKETEFVADLAYTYSDMTPIPMLSNFVDRITTLDENNRSRYPSDTKFEKVKAYLKYTIETIDQLNNKPIMGHIPDYKYYFDDLVKLYVDSGINTFYFNAHSSNPMTLQVSLRSLTRTLAAHGVLDECFIHMINPGIGGAPKDSSVIPAKDVLGFGFGIDGLGENHMPRYAPREKQKDAAERKLKLFDKEKYEYLKTSAPSDIEKFRPPDSSVGASEFVQDMTDPDLRKSFNTEQLALEGARLQDNLARSTPMLRYLEGKSSVTQGDIRALKMSKIRQSK